MLGACLFASVFLVVKDGFIPLPNGSADWLWIVILAVFCTVVAYSHYVELLKRLNIFTINFAGNLEPVYGIALASLFFQEHKNLNLGFYLGSGIIIASILLYPFVRRRTATRPA
jgi:drug/metabolite transporter (DMT)-like permease